MREIHNLKLLYAEDDGATRAEMVKFLKRRFSRVMAVADGREGVEKFLEQEPDIVITDLLMPGMGGLDFVAYLRERGYECPVLITTALDDRDSLLRSVDQGIVKYIIKPIDTAVLSETLDRTAAKIYRRKSAAVRFDIEGKRELERRIRLETAALLKKRGGKGPREIAVFLSGDTLEVTVSGALSPFESTLFAGGENRVLVEQNRRLFYTVLRGELEALLGAVLHSRVTLHDTRVSAEPERDRLLFNYFS